MILIHVSVQIKEVVADEFERTLRQVVTDARQMAGCVKYDWYRVPDSPKGFVIYGEFRSKEYFEK